MSAAEQSMPDLISGPTSMEGPSHKIVINPGSRRLLVFFSGTSKSNGRFDFWSSATAQQENLLFLNNGRNEWYQRQIPEFSSSIDDTAEKIQGWAKALNCNEIVTFGVSMGGYAAILFGTMLNARILALGFDSILRHPLSRSAGRMPKDTPVIQRKLRSLIENSRCQVTAITGDMDFSDLISLSRISDLPNVRSLTLRGVAHGVGRHINKFYGLADVIKNFVETDKLPLFTEAGTASFDKNLSRTIFQAHQQYVSKNHESALLLAQQALKKDPMSEPANFIAGMAHIGLKDYTSAAHNLAITHALTPNFYTAQFYLAKSLRLSGRLEQAAQHFISYISVRPDSVGAHHNLASIYKSLGYHKKSEDMSKLAKEIDLHNKQTLLEASQPPTLTTAITEA